MKRGLEGLREAWCVNVDAFRLYSSKELLPSFRHPLLQPYPSSLPILPISHPSSLCLLLSMSMFHTQNSRYNSFNPTQSNANHILSRFRDKPDIFANQARQCAILSTSSAMLYETPGQEDEDSGLRFRKITKEEYLDVLSFSRGMWERRFPEEQAQQMQQTQQVSEGV